MKRLFAPFLATALAVFGLLIFNSSALSQEKDGAKKLNVLWLVSDDLGVEAGCYGDKAVSTPNVDRLAAEGVRYTHAYSSAPVCSSSRSAFITGMYQTSIGAQHHRTRNLKPLPEGVRTLPELFKEAGYFVCNINAKTGKGIGKEDYNFITPENLYDGDDWSQRAEGQPFFAQVQIFEPHRTFDKNEDPDRLAKIELPPYYPDHPVTRADWANYLASVEEMDRKTGEFLDRLEQEGLADNTLVVFFGDHGRPHVRGKQWLYDPGLHTPLILRWPGHLEPGEVRDGQVSLIDLAPTSLAAAGLEIPGFMQGVDILADGFEGRPEIYAARDRCGDAVDRIRCVRTERYKYIRNFMPELPYTQHSGYKKQQYPVLTLMEVMQDQGRLTPEQALFMAPEKPEEELYDLEADPYEVHNLAADPAHAETLKTLRGKVETWIDETNDQGRFLETDEEIKAIKEEKYATFERGMKRRGLKADISDRKYLDWWKKELGVK